MAEEVDAGAAPGQEPERAARRAVTRQYEAATRHSASQPSASGKASSNWV